MMLEMLPNSPLSERNVLVNVALLMIQWMEELFHKTCQRTCPRRRLPSNIKRPAHEIVILIASARKKGPSLYICTVSPGPS